MRKMSNTRYDERRSMFGLEVIGGLVTLSVPLVALARRWRIPYPIVLVFGGLLLGFLSRPPQVHPGSEVVLAVFLSPLLYVEALTASVDEIRRQAGWIASLAVQHGLALLTRDRDFDKIPQVQRVSQ